MFILYFLLILLFLYFSCLLILDPNSFEPSFDYSIKNNFCQMLSPDAVLIDKIVCENPYKKKKFLWFMIDGLANSEVNHLRKKVKGKANLFQVNSRDFYRQSGALHEMYLTGKFSNNFVGDPILIDNLFYQMNQANHPLEFFGSPYPVAYLGGSQTQESQSLYYNKTHIGIEEYPFEMICPHLRDTLYNGVHLNIPAENFYDTEKLVKFLDEKIADYPKNITGCLSENSLYPLEAPYNLIYYTAMIDNHNHAFSKNNPNTFKVTYGVEKFILKMMDWIDQNPEYALILSSDHGGQDFFGEDSYCNHGCLKPENKGIFFAYVNDFLKNPPGDFQRGEEEFKGFPHQKEEIDIFDVAPTVSQLIENVNIPIFSKGVPAELGNDEILSFAALRSKEIQLLEYIKDFQSDKLSYKHESYQKIKNIKNLQDFKEMKTNGIYDKYKNEVLELSNYVEALSLKDNELYKFYPIAIFIIIFVFYIWVHFILMKKYEFSKRYYIFLIIWLNLYLDTFSAFFKLFSFEFTNKFTLYLSCIFFLITIKFLNKDLNLISEIKSFFGDFFQKSKKNEKNQSKQLPIYYQEFENLSKSFQINQMKSEKRNRLFISVFVFVFILILFLFTELYVDLKKFQSFWEMSQILDFINYPYFVYLLFSMISKENDHWFYKNNSFPISTLLKRYYLAVLFFMSLYDIKRPRNFVNQDWTQQYLTRIVYAMLFLHICWIFYNKERIYNKEMGKKKRLSGSCEMIANIKLPVLAYLFFLNDEIDRIIFCFLIIPFYQFMVKLYDRVDSPLKKIFILSFVLKSPDIFHVICKGTMTFDISLPAGNKTIGMYQDEYPIFTGVLFGTHKLQQYIIGAIFMMNIMGKNTVSSNDDEISIFKISFSKYFFCNLPLWYFVFSKQQSFYLIIFMFCMGKIMLVGLFYLLSAILKITDYIQEIKKKKQEE